MVRRDTWFVYINNPSELPDNGRLKIPTLIAMQSWKGNRNEPQNDSNNAFAIVADVWLRVGIACANRVKWYVITRMFSNPPVEVSSERKSMHSSFSA